MLRRNPDILAIAFVVLAIGVVTLIAEASHVVARNVDFDRGQRFARKVELIGERAEMIGKRIEEKAQRVERRVERLAKVWE